MRSRGQKSWMVWGGNRQHTHTHTHTPRLHKRFPHIFITTLFFCAFATSHHTTFLLKCFVVSFWFLPSWKDSSWFPSFHIYCWNTTSRRKRTSSSSKTQKTVRKQNGHNTKNDNPSPASSTLPACPFWQRLFKNNTRQTESRNIWIIWIRQSAPLLLYQRQEEVAVPTKTTTTTTSLTAMKLIGESF